MLCIISYSSMEVTHGVMVSTSAFLASTCHQCWNVGSSLIYGLNFGALVCGIYLTLATPTSQIILTRKASYSEEKSRPAPLDYEANNSRNLDPKSLFILHKSTYIHGNVLLGP